MNGRLMRGLLGLYPRAFRDRYGAELASVTEELIRAGEITPLLAVVNLAWGAALEWGRVLFHSRRAVQAMAAAAIIAVAGSLYVTSQAQPQGTPASGPAAYSASGRCVFWAKPSASMVVLLPLTAGKKAPALPRLSIWFVVPQTGPFAGKLSLHGTPVPAGFMHAVVTPAPGCRAVRVLSPVPAGWVVHAGPEVMVLKPSS